MLICLIDDAASVIHGGQDAWIPGDERHRKQRDGDDGPEAMMVNQTRGGSLSELWFEA